uniref:Uncharacterized protein n=1 Tax=Echinococcus granulosus TaxID=6210 RepID=A0A068WYU8_ECHGR|nr:hypothetical protein EgrG_002057200 [Echinococcus granulosus]
MSTTMKRSGWSTNCNEQKHSVTFTSRHGTEVTLLSSSSSTILCILFLRSQVPLITTIALIIIYALCRKYRRGCSHVFLLVISSTEGNVFDTRDVGRAETEKIDEEKEKQEEEQEKEEEENNVRLAERSHPVCYPEAIDQFLVPEAVSHLHRLYSIHGHPPMVRNRAMEETAKSSLVIAMPSFGDGILDLREGKGMEKGTERRVDAG